MGQVSEGFGLLLVGEVLCEGFRGRFSEGSWGQTCEGFLKCFSEGSVGQGSVGFCDPASGGLSIWGKGSGEGSVSGVGSFWPCSRLAGWYRELGWWIEGSVSALWGS